MDHLKSEGKGYSFLPHAPERIIVDEAYGAALVHPQSQPQRHEFVRRIARDENVSSDPACGLPSHPATERPRLPCFMSLLLNAERFGDVLGLTRQAREVPKPIARELVKAVGYRSDGPVLRPTSGARFVDSESAL